MKNNKKMSGSEKIAIGAGIATVGAGAYYLFGPKGKAHQKKATVLMSKIKKEVVKEVKKAEKVTLPIYHNVVDTVSANYAKQYKIHQGDIKILAKKLKSEWKDVNKLAQKTVKTLKKKSK